MLTLWQLGIIRMQLAPLVQATEFPPIAEAMSWVAPGAFTSKRNRELLNMCQAVPSYPPAPALQAEFARLAQEPGTGGYTDIFGIADLRKAYASRMTVAYGAPIDASNVAITTGCNQAFAAAVMSVAQAGDELILPAPHYFNHQMWLTMLGIRGVAIPAIGTAGYPLVEDARKAITPRTRAILLCTPNNPSGAIYPAAVIEAFYALAREHGLALIMDETYRDFRPSNEPPHQLFAQPGWEHTVIHLYSFSKIYAIAGYRLGAMTAGPKLLHEAAKILDCMTICPPQIAQRGVLFALGGVDDWIAAKKMVMAGRLAALRSVFDDPSLTYKLASSGAYFAYIAHPFAGEESKRVAKRLAQEHDLLSLPGSMFGEGQENYLRLAFANVDAEKMTQLAERLKESQR
jgi:aspartate/methionine/tyrosine aminotransferase